MRVLKFGGTSVKDASALLRVLDIVSQRVDAAQPMLVVLSATSGTTDELHQAATALDVDAADRIRERHHAVVSALADTPLAHADVDDVCNALQSYLRGMRLLSECTPRSVDEVLSYGERLSTTIFYHACRSRNMRVALLDARTIVRTNDAHGNALANTSAIHALCSEHVVPMLATNDVIITQGFVGATADGVTTTLGRGGSDYSAALLGASLSAGVIEIWTDVSGVYSADPRHTASARPIPRMGFAEVRDLALHGAKVLHPNTIEPAMQAGIPVHVLNTFDPQAGGTVITADGVNDVALHAVSVMHHCTMVQWRGTDRRGVPQHVLRWSYGDGTACVVRTATESEKLDLEVAFSDLPHSSASVSVIAVCGPRASAPAAVALLTAAVRGMDVMAVISGASVTTCFLVCSQESTADVVHAVHNVVIHS